MTRLGKAPSPTLDQIHNKLKSPPPLQSVVKGGPGDISGNINGFGPVFVTVSAIVSLLHP